MKPPDFRDPPDFSSGGITRLTLSFSKMFQQLSNGFALTLIKIFMMSRGQILATLVIPLTYEYLNIC